MSSRLTGLSEDQRDALQELMNVAMGQGADRLARLTETFVTLSVPRIHPVGVANSALLEQLMLASQPVIITRQSFLGRLRGEVIVCFGENGADQLAGLMGYEGAEKGGIQDELVLDVTNILTGACINGLAQQVEMKVSYGSPSLFSRGRSLQEVLGSQEFQDHQALVLEIHFEVATHSFYCDLLVCITEDTVDTVIELIDRLLSDI
ncbi:chemotaxis protein CheC [Pseudomonas sp. LPB0260]|jgi:chemotaxis protein CheC|uniref:chemotaxis protein CheC n=1 Tax=Pseudomonas sp. LPB0260 TaxID=2614442 RepID=UPI0015C26646|nr:chemotaxis protein CheC [Pseudomonas sp. LPB0260]QLC74479.1 chemotaxis protein CheC [Pseudomonas sp. LPB0260]QLC77249.1 chemotaxis protein CheC [Pseudomonas sp. LPB0260]